MSDQADMRGSKHQKGDKMDIPMPVNVEMSSPSQQDKVKVESSIKNSEKHWVDEQKDTPCSSNTPD